MYLSKIGGTGFLGYKQLDLKVEPGLTLIDGVNHHYATASSNASGKSSLQEVIAYSAFAETIRNLEYKDSVIHKGASSASVYSEYVRNDEKVLRIERYRKHPRYHNDARILLDGKDISGRYIKNSQNVIEDYLGFDFSLLKRAIIIHSRRTESFSSVKDSYLKQIIEKLIGLPDFSVLLESVKEDTRIININVDRLSDKVGFLRQSIEEKRIELINLKYKSAKAQLEIDKAKEQLDKQIDKIAEGIKALQINIKRYKSKLESLKEMKKYAVEERDVARSHSQLVSNAYFKKNARRTLMLKQIEKYKKIKGSVCPDCGQHVSASHIRAKVSAIEKESQALVKELHIDKVRMTRQEILANKRQNRIDELDKEIEGLSAKFHQGTADLKSSNKILDSLKEDKKKENPYIKLIADARHYIKTKKENLVEIRHQLFKRKRSLLYYEFWRRGFGPDGIRSYILDAVNPVINRIANVYLDILTDGNMWVNLNTVKPKKDGTYRDGFEIEIENMSGSDELSGGSDGELHSIDLALNLAMSDILESRIAGGFGFMFVDQAIDLLDTVRGRKAIRLLYNKLDSKWCADNQVPHKRSIWLITHREALKDLVENVIRVEKKGGVCRLLSEQ